MSTQRAGLGLPAPISQRRLPDLLSDDQWIELTGRLGLSTRQSQILHCAFYDERDCSIALRLGLSEHTVHTQRMRLFRKLGVTSMVQVVAVAASAWFDLSKRPGRGSPTITPNFSAADRRPSDNGSASSQAKSLTDVPDKASA